MKFLIMNILDTLILNGIQPALIKEGHEVKVWADYKMTSKPEQECYNEIWEVIRDNKCDYVIFLGSLYNSRAFYAIPDACKYFGIGFIYWAIEDPVEFDSTLYMAQNSYLTLSPAIECVEKYKTMGINAHLFLFACNPNFHRIGEFRNDLNYDAVLAANGYVQAADGHIHHARLKGYDIIVDSCVDLFFEQNLKFRLYGNYWNNPFLMSRFRNKEDILYGWYLPNEFLPSLCRSSKIILGVQCDDSSITQTSLRPYEILGCGGFHLAQWTKATENIFKEGIHLITAKTKEEAKEKIKFYLDKPSLRKRIAMQGQEYVYKEHTYERRVKDIILKNLY